MIFRPSAPYMTAAAAVIAFGLASGYAAHHLRTEVLAAAESRLLELCRTALLRGETYFEHVETIIDDVIALHPPLGADSARQQSFRAAMHRRLDGKTQIASFSVIDSKGIVEYAESSATQGLKAGNRSYFTHFASLNSNKDLFISEPDSAANSEHLIAAKPKRGSDNRLEAVIAAALPVAALTELLKDAVPPYPLSTLTLLNTDRWILTRAVSAPDSGEQINVGGMRMGAQALLETLLQSGKTEHVIVGASGIDGMVKMAAQIKSPRYPLAVSAAAPLDSILGEWRDKAFVLAGFWAASSVLVVLAAFMVERSLRKLRRAALLSSNRQSFMVDCLDSLPGIMMAVDRDGKLIHWNRRLEDVAGYAHGAVETLSPLDFFSGDERGLVGQRLSEAFTAGSAFYEARLHTAEGKLVPFAFTAGLTKLSNSPVLVMFGIDISEIKALQAGLERSNTDLSRFAYIASHQLQEPLRTISGYVQLLERRYCDVLDHDAHEFISYAVNGAKRLSELISDLLEFSHVSTAPPELAPTDLNAVVIEAALSLKTALEESGGELNAAPLPNLQAERRFLVILFQTLLANAVRYRSVERRLQITVAAKRLHGVWEFRVADNGIGIAREYRAKVFEVFQRLHSGSYAGTGIGLALARKIVERHNGRIWIEDNPDHIGTCICFTLDAFRKK